MTRTILGGPVVTEADLNDAIALANGVTEPSACEIDITDGTLDMSQLVLAAISLQAGVSLTIKGNGATLDGGGTDRGLFVYSGVVRIEDLTIQSALAAGGPGGAGDRYGGGGGGAAGLGGGLFVAGSQATGAAVTPDVTLDGVVFSNDAARGGAGGAAAGGSGRGGGGGGGMFGGGDIGSGRSGGQGGSGVMDGSAGSPGTGRGVGAGGFGGGGGGGGSSSGHGGHGGVGGGGGGGGSSSGDGGAGGFGGGGGGGGSSTGSGGAGGAGAGAGGEGRLGSGGGGGLGAGGDVFVQAGGSLTVIGGSFTGGAVLAGAGGAGSGGGRAGSAGMALGAGIFIQGNDTVALAAPTSDIVTINDAIADGSSLGDHATGAEGGPAGAGGLVIGDTSGLDNGTVVLAGANSYSNGTEIVSGTLKLASATAAGTGAIRFGSQTGLMLDVGAGDVPANIIAGFAAGDSIDLEGIGTASAATMLGNNALTVVSGPDTVQLNFSLIEDFSHETFAVAADGNGGTVITMIASPEITAVAYDAATGVLTLTGRNFTSSVGDYALGGATFTGANGGTYRFGFGDRLTGISATALTIQIGDADQVTLDGLLNAVGVTAANAGTTYNFAVTAGWDTGAAASLTNAITVTDSGTPTLSNADTISPIALTTGGSSVTVDNGTILVTDSPDLGGSGAWSGGALQVAVGPANRDDAADALGVGAGGSISVSGSGAGAEISYNDNLIGTVDAGATGAAGQPLQIDLSGPYATDAAVQALVNAITFSESQGTTAGDRSVDFTLIDAYGNSPTPLSDTVHVLAPPTVTSINRSIVAATPTSAGSVTFDVTFSEPVTGIFVGDFSPVRTGTVSIDSMSVNGSGADWTVVLGGVTGDGTLGLDLSSAGSIQDGNTIALAGTHTSDQTYTIDHTAPVIGNLDTATTTFVTDAPAPVLLDTGGITTVTEANIASGGTLTVSIPGGQAGEDVLGFDTTGSISAQVTGTSVTLLDGLTTVGRYTSSNPGSLAVADGDTLIVALSAGDTTAQVADLLHALTYADSSLTPDTTARTVDITLADAAGNISAAGGVTVQLEHAPTLSVEGTATVARLLAATLDPTAMLSDADNDWNGGSLTIVISDNATAGDTLSLPASSSDGIWLSGTTVMDGSTAIATASAATAAASTPWVFTFHPGVDNAMASALAQAIQFQSSVTTDTRTVLFHVTDNHGVGVGTLDLIDVVAPPTITDVPESQSVSDLVPTAPFAETVIDGGGGAVTVNLSFADPYGDLAGVEGWNSVTDGSTRTYTREFDSASLAQTALRAVNFVPVQHEAAIGTTQELALRLTVMGTSNGVSASTTDTLTITYANSTPAFTAGTDGSVTSVNGAAVVVGAGLIVADPDYNPTLSAATGNWGGGVLAATDSGIGDTSHDILGIGTIGGITTSGSAVGSTVSYDATRIGTIFLDGAAGSDLVVRLNDAAANEAVTALARAIQFSSPGTSNANSRTVTVVAADAIPSRVITHETVDLALNPAQTTITRYDDAAELSNAASAQFDVRFSTPVSGVAASDFSAIDGTGLTSGDITLASNLGGGSDTDWIVTVHGLSGAGTLGLVLNSIGTIQDGNARPLLTTVPSRTVQTYTIDRIPPVVTSVAVPDAGTAITGQVLDFTVIFSKPVLLDTTGGIPSIPLTLDTGGTVDAAYVSGSGSNALVFAYVVHTGQRDLTGIALGGSIVLNGATLRDATTNSAVTTLAGVASTSSVLVDAINPTVLSIDPVGPTPTNASRETFTVTFSTGVSGLSAADFTATGTGTVTAGALSLAGSGATYTVSVDGVSGDGALSLALSSIGSIEDGAGNALLATYHGDRWYAIDNTAPPPPVITSPGLSVRAAPVISGTAEAGDTVAITVGGAQYRTVATGAAWTIDLATATPDRFSLALDDRGANPVFATATDPAGNISTPATQSLIIDTTTPPATSIQQTRSSGITGAAPAGSTVSLRDGSVVVAIVQTDSDGHWSFLPSTLDVGNHVLTATVEGLAGNVSAASAPITLSVAADHGFTINSSAGGIDSSAVYDAHDVLVATTTNIGGLPAQTVTPETTLRSIYDAGGTLIGTVTEAGSSDGVAPPGYRTAGTTTGATTVTDAAPSIVQLYSGSQSLVLAGSDTVIAAGGNDTIRAAGATASVSGGAGRLTFYGGSSDSTVTGGSGSVTVAGGGGGGRYSGGTAAGNVLAAGGGNTSLVGGQHADLLFGSAGQTIMTGSTGGADTIIAGAGSNTIQTTRNDVVFAIAGHTTIQGGSGGDTMVGGANDLMIAGNGTNMLFGGAGSDTLIGGAGATTLVGGSGNTLMKGGLGGTEFVGGPGQSTVIGGAAHDTVWTGAGRMQAELGRGASTLILGSGHANIVEGEGSDLYDVINGQAGGTQTIAGFRPGTDRIALYGYHSGPMLTHVGGGTVLTLSDGTTITLSGVTSLDANSIV